MGLRNTPKSNSSPVSEQRGQCSDSSPVVPTREFQSLASAPPFSVSLTLHGLTSFPHSKKVAFFNHLRLMITSI